MYVIVYIIYIFTCIHLQINYPACGFYLTCILHMYVFSGSKFKGTMCKILIIYGEVNGTKWNHAPGVRKSLFPCDLGPFNDRNKHFPALAIPSTVHSTPSWGLLYLPWVYYTFRGFTIPSVGLLYLLWVYYTFRWCTIPSST